MKKIVSILLLLIISTSVFAQNKAILALRVADARTGLPVEGAVVQYAAGTSLTNELGFATLQAGPAKADTIHCAALGYSRMAISMLELARLGNKVLLMPDVVQLREMTLVATQTKPLTLISKLDIKMRGLNNAQEILRMVPGLFIGQHAGGGKAEQIFLRGFDIDHGTDVAITADGMPVNMVSHAHGQGYADLHFLIPEVIEQVQFGKGPYQANIGNFATAGYVNMESKKQLEQNLVKIEAGQFNTLRTLGMWQVLKPGATGKKGLYVAGEYLRSRGFFDAPQDFNRLNFFTRYDQAIGKNSQLDISASTFRSSWNASGQIPNRSVASGAISFFGAIDPNEGGNTNRSNINARLRTQLSENSYLKNQLYYTAYDFDLFSNFTFFLNDPVNGDQIRQKEKRSLWGYNGAFVHQGFNRFFNYQFEGGLSLRADKTRNSQLAHTLNRKQTLQNLQLGDVQEWNAAAYMQETIHFGSQWILQGGLRLDQFMHQYADKLSNQTNQKHTAIVSPKMNLTWQLSNKAALYLSAGRGFHSNDSRVVAQTKGREALPAAWGTDLGINAKPAKNLFLNIALWRLNLEQEFVYVGDEGVVEPSGSTRRMGIDVSARYQPLRHLFLDADFNYAFSEFTDLPKTENKLPLAPRFTAVGGVTYKKPTGINGSLRYRWMGDRPATEDGSIEAKGYFVADAVIACPVKQFEFSLNVQNIFDARWKETQFATTSRLQNEADPVTEIHFTPGTPFFLRAGVMYRF